MEKRKVGSVLKPKMTYMYVYEKSGKKYIGQENIEISAGTPLPVVHPNPAYEPCRFKVERNPAYEFINKAQSYTSTDTTGM